MNGQRTLTMSDVERYASMMQTALEIQQKQTELSRLYSKLSAAMTVNELMKRTFSNETAGKAFKLLEGVEFERCDHVGSELIYKDVEIYLHEELSKIGAKAMKNCLAVVSTKRLLA